MLPSSGGAKLFPSSGQYMVSQIFICQLFFFCEIYTVNFKKIQNVREPEPLPAIPFSASPPINSWYFSVIYSMPTYLISNLVPKFRPSTFERHRLGQKLVVSRPDRALYRQQLLALDLWFHPMFVSFISHGDNPPICWILARLHCHDWSQQPLGFP